MRFYAHLFFVYLISLRGEVSSALDATGNHVVENVGKVPNEAGESARNQLVVSDEELTRMIIILVSSIGIVIQAITPVVRRADDGLTQARERSESNGRILAELKDDVELLGKSVASVANHVKGSEERIKEEVMSIVSDTVSSSTNQLQSDIGGRLDQISQHCIRKDQLDAIIKGAIVGNNCRYPYITLGKGCYHFSGEGMKMTWDEGRKYCRLIGGDYAAIETAEEGAAIRQFLIDSNVQKNSVLGGRDLKGNGDWYWMDTSRPVRWFDWAEGEPSEKAEKCMEIDSRQGFRWNDYYCDSKNSVVCELAV